MDEFEKVNKGYFDKVAIKKEGNYQQEASNRLSDYVQSKNRKIILHNIEFKENLLDIGCGNGDFTNELNKIAPTTGIDISEEMIKLANKSFPDLKFLNSPVYKLPFKSKSFDSVICLNTIHHIKNTEKAIREICRVTKNQILIEIKNKYSLNYLRRSLIKNNNYRWKPTTVKEIKTVFNRYNFKLYKKYNILPILNPVYLLDFRRNNE